MKNWKSKPHYPPSFCQTKSTSLLTMGRWFSLNVLCIISQHKCGQIHICIFVDFCVCLCRGLWIKICIWVAGDHVTRLRVGRAIENSFQITSSSQNVLHYALFYHFLLIFLGGDDMVEMKVVVASAAVANPIDFSFFHTLCKSEKKERRHSTHVTHTTLNDDTIQALLSEHCLE